jgi:uncharacterized membrane protein YccC
VTAAILRARTRWLLPYLPSNTTFVLRTLLAFAIAVYVSYQLELDSPYSSGTTVLIVAANARGAILSKSFWRIMGSVAGVAASIVLIAGFVQSPVLFIFMLAIWFGFCTFVSSMLRYFRSYGAVLAGYTVTLVAVPAVSDPDHIFELATARLSLVVIGVLATALVFLITDHGPDPNRLRYQAASLCADVAKFIRAALMGTDLTTRSGVRDRIAAGLMALDQAVEFTAAEDAVFRRRASDPRIAAAALLAALTGAERVCQLLRDPARAADGRVTSAREAVRDLADFLAQPAHGPGGFASRRARIDTVRRRVAEEAASCRDIPVLAVLDQTIDLLDQLRLAADRFATLDGQQSLSPMLRLPVYANPFTALRNGMRGALAVAIAGLFWIISQWPSGGAMLALLGPVCGLLAQSESAAAASVAFLKGTALSSVAAFVVTFGILPQTTGFPLLTVAFMPFLAVALFGSLRPGNTGLMWIAFLIFFVTQVGPNNPMHYDLAASLNTYLAYDIGAACGVLAFRVLLPPNPRREAMVLMRSIRHGVARAARDRVSLPITWEHLQHQKLIRLSRRLATAPIDRVMALEQSITAVLVGRALLRLRDLLARPEAGPTASAATTDARVALRRLHIDPLTAATAARKTAETLVRQDDAPAVIRHIAATLHELTALLSADADFFATRSQTAEDP